MSYPSLVPYLLVGDARALISFLETAFGATVRVAVPGEGAKIMHGELTLGDGVIFVSDCVETPRVTYLCHYVADVDATYAAALAAGALSVSPPEDKEYGQRLAGVKDPAGNVWWICAELG